MLTGRPRNSHMLAPVNCGGQAMGQGATTVVIEPRSLVREALVSLMTNHSFRVCGGFDSTANLHNSWPAEEAPDLVILGSLRANEAANVADNIRKRWPEAKMILLFDGASSADFQMLLGSEIDGCIPLFASPDILVGTIQQIMAGDLRILVTKAGTTSMACPTGTVGEVEEASLAPKNLAPVHDAQGDSVDHKTSLRIVHGLSPREEEILKSVVRGHSNKMIARTCGVTDATIKVHMKSILRKIRVENRTQAAIWALERGYGADASSPALRTQREFAAA